MNLKNWVRRRWWELRTGAGNYLTMAVTFFNLVILLSLKFDVTGNAFIYLAILTFMGLSSTATAIGYAHRLWQQDTDARLANKALIEDIVDGVVRELKK